MSSIVDEIIETVLHFETQDQTQAQEAQAHDQEKESQDQAQAQDQEEAQDQDQAQDQEAQDQTQAHDQEEAQDQTQEAQEEAANSEERFSSKVYVDESIFVVNAKKILDSYYMFNNFLTNDEIDRIHRDVQSITIEDGTISSVGEISHVESSFRRSNIRWIPPTNKFKWLYDRILEYARYANDEIWGFQIFGLGEDIQYGEYSSEYKGKYEGHLDIGRGRFSLRKISITIQLTDQEEYEGGDLTFNIGNKPTYASRKKGAIVFFPSYFHHQVTPVTKGVRYSLVTWITGPSWQ